LLLRTPCVCLPPSSPAQLKATTATTTTALRAMMMMRYVLLACAFCVWFGCGCVGAEKEDNRCKDEAKKDCPAPEDPSSAEPADPGPRGAEGLPGVPRPPVNGITSPSCPSKRDGEEACKGVSQSAHGKTVSEVTCTSPQVTTEGTKICPESMGTISEVSGQIPAVPGAGLGGDPDPRQKPAAALTCSTDELIAENEEACKTRASQGLQVGVPATTGGTGGGGGPKTPAESRGPVLDEVGGQMGRDGENGKLENNPVGSCSAASGGATDCSLDTSLLHAQQQQSKLSEKRTAGDILGEEDSNLVSTGTRGGRQDALTEKGDAPNAGHDGNAADTCVNGRHKETGKNCNLSVTDNTLQTNQRKDDESHAKDPKTPGAKEDAPIPDGDNTAAMSSGATPSVPPVHEAGSAASDHRNGEPSESTAQAAVEQSDAVQSQTSPTSTSTSATEATSSSQP
ncbi:hypothetical protein DQ04_20941000, partial [Trypanosoma grayi]|uniref:hypothetical protein n=1 Tax=Trypanosoma grayi TaxID=71804 RepID=UPI0004F4B900